MPLSRHQRSGASTSSESTGGEELPGGARTVLILNKEAERDLDLTLDFGAGRTDGIEIETLQAPALDALEAHITPEARQGTPKQGRYVVTVSHASGMRITAR